MKKLLCFLSVITIFIACNSNPSATGDKIIMQEERKDNAIEFQKNPIDSVPSDTAVIDTSIQTDSARK